MKQVKYYSEHMSPRYFVAFVLFFLFDLGFVMLLLKKNLPGVFNVVHCYLIGQAMLQFVIFARLERQRKHVVAKECFYPATIVEFRRGGHRWSRTRCSLTCEYIVGDERQLADSYSFVLPEAMSAKDLSAVVCVDPDKRGERYIAIYQEEPPGP